MSSKTEILVQASSLSPSIGKDQTSIETSTDELEWKNLKDRVGVSIREFLDKVRERQEKSLQQLKLPGKIFSHSDHKRSSIFLRDDVKDQQRSLDADFKDIFKFNKAVRALYNGFKKPLKESEVAIKAEMSEFILEEDKRTKEAVGRIDAELDASAMRRRNDHVAQLVNEGKTGEAIALMVTETESSDLVARTSTFQRPKVEGSHIITIKTFDLLDVSKLNSEYVIPEQVIPESPDMSMISRVVRKHGVEAEKIVGEGAIRYREEIRIASTTK